jgi:ABC-type nitrate/sulfonate/bicarbonate transport system permease component
MIDLLIGFAIGVVVGFALAVGALIAEQWRRM